MQLRVPHSRLRRRTGLLTLLLLASSASAIPRQSASQVNCVYPPGAKLWSDPASWGGTGGVPGYDSNPIIGRTETFILDADTAQLGTLTIKGRLIFAEQDLLLEANQIIIDGGHLDVGGHCGPFQHQATILIRQPDCNQVPQDYGIIVKDGGLLELRGKDYSPSWTRLAQTAKQGDTSILLDQSVNWPVNGEIVLASTDFDMELCEEHSVQAVASGLVTLNGIGMAHEHFAGEVGTPPHTVPEFGEVALLTRNIIIQGTPVECTIDGNTFKYGGHVRFERSDPSKPAPIGLLDWVTFKNLGNAGQMGQYPLHFHRVGDLSASHVKNCSITYSNNKGLVIHNSQNLVATGNVVFDTLSHAYYMEEDGQGPSSSCPEEMVVGCTLDNNLGLLTRAAASGHMLHEHDAKPGTFYMRNWDNTITNNAAAGSASMGFYHRMPNECLPTGAYLQDYGNVAHSNGQHGWYHNDRPRVNLDPASNQPYVQGLNCWKNREYGIWLRAYQAVSISNSTMADNRTGLYVGSAGRAITFPDTTVQYVHDLVIVGESPQNKYSEPASAFTTLEQAHGRSLPAEHSWMPPCLVVPPLQPLAAITDYDGLIAIGESNLPQHSETIHIDHFADFDYSTPSTPGWIRQSAAFTQIPGISPWAVDPRNFVRNVNMVKPGAGGSGVRRPVLMRDAGPDQNGIANTVLFDIEGDIVSWLHDNSPVAPPCVPSGTPSYFFPDTAILSNISAASTPPCFDSDVNGWLWSPDMTSASTECIAQLEIVDCSPDTCSEPTHADFWHMDAAVSPAVTLASFRSINPPEGSVHAFVTNVPLVNTPSDDFRQNLFLATWERITKKTQPSCEEIDLLLYEGCGGSELVIPDKLIVNLHYARVGAVVYFGIPLAAKPTSVTSDVVGTPIPEVPRLSDLWGAPNDTWCWSTNTAILPVQQGAGVMYGKIVVEDGGTDAISTVLNDPALQSFYDGAPASFYINCPPGCTECPSQTPSCP